MQAKNNTRYQSSSPLAARLLKFSQSTDMMHLCLLKFSQAILHAASSEIVKIFTMSFMMYRRAKITRVILASVVSKDNTRYHCIDQLTR